MRNRLLKSIAAKIEDYRVGEVDRPTPGHINRWISQFDAEVQVPILAELDHVLKKTYFSRTIVEEFLKDLVTNDKIAGSDPCAFWNVVEFLDIQGGGNSQFEMLQFLGIVLKNECGFGTDSKRNNPKCYIYLDDAIFTGNRVLNDLRRWIVDEAPAKANLHVIVIGLHRGGKWYANNNILKVAKDAKKDIDITWWRYIEMEDRRAYITSSDVLRPVSLPDETLTQQYVERMRYSPVLRTPGNVGLNGFFSTEKGRHILEQEFLKAGLRIRSMCPYLNDYQRPLGNMVLETLGFGTMIVTFRNCPNNTPLAFWAGDPWYPLFPRKVNQ